MSLPFLRTLQGDRFFQLLILVGIGLSFFVPFAPKSWPAAIDWHTIITLSGLMLLTKGVELSGYFDVLGRKMVRRFATERRLAMFMVLAAALLSTFLTNDVALFIVVPLTITLKRLCEIPVNRLIIFCPVLNFFNDTATTEIYTLSLHDALPICHRWRWHCR